MTIDRRTALAAGLALAAGACVPIEHDLAGRFGALLRIIEAQGNGTLGVAVLDTGTGRVWGHADYARFPHLSSFKLSLAALVLHLDETGAIDAGEHVTWSTDDLLAYAPFARERLEQGATLRELAEFTQKLSDNTAANLLLRRLGGPERLTAFWRALGDETSRLDRYEPELNLVPPGEIKDTTTPAAMARTLGKLLYGDALGEAARATLKLWMADTHTGTKRVRAGLPPEWPAGDKTGTSLAPGMGSVYVDVGYVEPPARAPLTFAAYFRAARQHTAADAASEAVLAEVGRVIARYARAT
ncbi:class A beta-lactamase [Pelagerythrobacter rhizovicinus]|uniref:beta-lactamase n=1 Tax=Pelagerythrobacter rhizovicinus TaxID=2268576 RepID=A0A4Q2KJ72_9SPHN|nr:class A beta-lactamase [Pelagerythrobacter rhizovicinus]RXZ64399.1 class A beta-lactamase [Pelagerythrobacter rhizovicinus]